MFQGHSVILLQCVFTHQRKVYNSQDRTTNLYERNKTLGQKSLTACCDKHRVFFILYHNFNHITIFDVLKDTLSSRIIIVYSYFYQCLHKLALVLSKLPKNDTQLLLLKTNKQIKPLGFEPFEKSTFLCRYIYFNINIFLEVVHTYTSQNKHILKKELGYGIENRLNAPSEQWELKP